jgi:hypothetical protein
MDCPSFTGYLKVRRTSAKSNEPEKEYSTYLNQEGELKYPLVFDADSEMLVGLYYIELSYTEKEPSEIEYALLIDGRTDIDYSCALASHKPVYG